MKSKNTRTGFNFEGAQRVGDKFAGKDVKVAISFRLDPSLLSEIRAEAERLEMPYQTLMHRLLAEAIVNRRVAKIERKRLLGERIQKGRKGA
jgi:predicted DNA binding CopG/RHH family protein